VFFISVINQLDVQNFCFVISLYHAFTCFEHMCSKHVEAWNKLIVKQKCCASSWLITEMHGLQNLSLSLSLSVSFSFSPWWVICKQFVVPSTGAKVVCLGVNHSAWITYIKVVWHLHFWAGSKSVNYHPLPCITSSYITFSQILMPATLLLLRVGTIELLVWSGKIFIPDKVKICQWILKFQGREEPV